MLCLYPAAGARTPRARCSTRHAVLATHRVTALSLADALPPLVLLHGLGTGPSAWGPQVALLEVERRVMAPSLVPAIATGALDDAVLLVERAVRGTASLDL